MSRSHPFDELGDHKPIPKPNHPQREIPLYRRPKLTEEEKRRGAEHLKKLREQTGF